MNNLDSFEILDKLRCQIEKELTSLDDSVISEAQLRRRKVHEIIAKCDELGIPVPFEIKSEQETLECIISTRQKFIRLADDLSTLSKNIKDQLKNRVPQKRAAIPRSAPKKLYVTFSDGAVFSEGTATNVFISTLQHIGFRQISELEYIQVAGYPLVSTRKNKSGRQICEMEGYYIEAHSSTEQKANFIRRIANECGVDLNVDVIAKGSADAQ